MSGPLGALTQQQTGHEPREKMVRYQVNSKLLGLFNAPSESCNF